MVKKRTKSLSKNR